MSGNRDSLMNVNCVKPTHAERETMGGQRIKRDAPKELKVPLKESKLPTTRIDRISTFAG